MPLLRPPGSESRAASQALESPRQAAFAPVPPSLASPPSCVNGKVAVPQNVEHRTPRPRPQCSSAVTGALRDVGGREPGRKGTCEGHSLRAAL